MHDSFELVKRKRQRKKKLGCIKEDINFEVKLNRKFQTALEEFESSQFCLNILKEVVKIIKSLNCESVSDILCYGIGNFSESKSSLHQLAALYAFYKQYNCAVKVYDPVFNSTEVKFLEELKFTVLTKNEEGKGKIADNKPTLVFLPHCPKQLTNNFLWANWDVKLCNCLLIGNSFSKIIQDNTTKVLEESAGYILKIFPNTREILLEDCYHIDNTFNDISLHYFQCEKTFFQETLSEEPNYSGDIELVTENIKNLTVENGW